MIKLIYSNISRSVACFLLLTSVFITLVGAGASAQNMTLPKGEYSDLSLRGTGIVTQVIDQQRLSLHDGRIIYLTGLNFPNYHPYDPSELSLTALKVLRDMLIGQQVNIYQTKKKKIGRTNRMGHYLAHIERKSDHAWIQGTLLSLGLANVRTTKRNPEMAAQMYALEQSARKNKSGVWANVQTDIHTPEGAKNYINSFGIIEGIITKVAMRNNQIYLNFGQDWRDDFTVMIKSGDKRSFNKAGIDPLQWNGHVVRVRGWIESYNGPMIAIDHPERIEILMKPQDQ